MEPLEGQALLEKVRELGNLSKEEKARACGYYTVTKNDVERVNMMKFLNALIDAEGIELDSKANGNENTAGDHKWDHIRHTRHQVFSYITKK